ncbi:Aldo/keto reductase [Armillaria gallica]|uniref:Aldo/keto reductase n=1 Tax=Armillaria gallica TaxID=47427 RepID=A0A2H3CYK5_ARMGA|nr:Aldo/keto reductase [Armillaria gallica]
MSQPNCPSSIPLLDSAHIPWLGWENGFCDMRKTALKSGSEALCIGIRHIDTYRRGDDIWVTSKISECPSPDSKNPKNSTPIPLTEVCTSIKESLTKLGFIPDFFLIHSPYIAEDQEASPKMLNFRPQDLKVTLEGARRKPVVNQLEYHPYVLTHLEPVLAIQKEHNIIMEAYGPLTPAHSSSHGWSCTTILLASPMVRAMGVVAVTASGNKGRIRRLTKILYLPDGLLNPEEVQEISDVGKTVHWCYYTEHMEKDFPLPQLPTGL